MTTLEQFLADYTGDREVVELEVSLDQHKQGKSPFIVVRNGDYAVVINPQGLSNHLSVDVHSFVKGESATGGVIALANGGRYALEPPTTGTTSHAWNSAELVAVVVGVQGVRT